MTQPKPAPDIRDKHGIARPLVDQAAGFLLGLVVASACTLLGFVATRLVPHANLSLLYLTGVLLVAAKAGLWPALATGVASFLAYNFFFTPPYYTFEVNDDGDVSTLLFFLVMAGIAGQLAARFYHEARSRQASLNRLAELYAFAREMSAVAAIDGILVALHARIVAAGLGPVLLVRLDQPVDRIAELPSGLPSAKSWPVLRDGWELYRLASERRGLAVLGVRPREVDEGERDLLRGLCELALLAAERVWLEQDLAAARLVGETEQLRSALLSSVSHDLRTPLAAVIGSATSVLEYGDGMHAHDRHELLDNVVNEARRLDRYIQNLLDMTRLDQGGITLRRDWVDVGELVAGALQRLAGETRDRRLDVDLASGLPLLWAHGLLLEQALVNLLDNALRYAPADRPIGIAAWCEDTELVIQVSDQGPGIAPDERARVFDMFYRARQGDGGNRIGSGLGLAICRGLVGAHGGSLQALDGPNGVGISMQVRLPLVIQAGVATDGRN